MGEHANVTLVRQMIDAMNRGDMQAASDALADDVEWHEIGRAEARHGKAGPPGRDDRRARRLHDHGSAARRRRE